MRGSRWPRALALAVAGWVFAGWTVVGSASAQPRSWAEGLDSPMGPPRAQPSQPPPVEAGDESAQPVDAEPTEAEEAWPGPQVQLSYAYLHLADGYGGGDAHTASLAVFVHLPLPEIRLGVHADIGARDYSLGGYDLLMRGAVEIGVQLPSLIDPFVPHLSAIVTGGGIVGTRFDTTVGHGFGGAGLELGAELRLYRNLHLAFAVSYLRLEMDGAAFDVFYLRVGFGV